MNVIKLISNILLFITISVQAVFSQPVDPLYFDKIKTNFLISAFMQDSDGFFWIASNNGLHKYNGHSFKHYTAGDNSIIGSNVTTLFEDSQGLIWIGTSAGISVYSKETDTFITYLNDPNDPHSISSNRISDMKLQAITEDANGIIWIATEAGLNRFDRITQMFTHYKTQFIDNNIWSLLIDRQQFLWVGTANGLHKFDTQTGDILEQYESNNNDKNALHGNYLSSLVEDHDGSLWIGTTNEGVNHLINGQFRHYQHNPNDTSSLSDNHIMAILRDIDNQLWFTTTTVGLNLFDRNTQTFIHYQYDENNPSGLNGNILTDMYQDNLGIIWIAGYGGMLYRIDNHIQKFKQLVNQSHNYNSLGKGDYIGGVIEDSDGIIWVTVGGDGLNRYDPQTQTFTHYRHDPNDPDSLPVSYGQALIDDKQGHLWLSTDKDIVLFDKQTGKMLQHHIAKSWPSSPAADVINPDIIWWGTWGSGLLKFNTANGEQTYFTASDTKYSVSDNTIPFLYQDMEGMLWLCTKGGGLDKFDPRTGKVVAKYKHNPADAHSISSNLLFQMYQDSQKRYWVTTDKGLNRFYPETGLFKHYRKKNGLFPFDATTQIVEHNGYLWVAGYNQGEIVKFNPESGEYQLYSTDDGVLKGIGSSYRALKTHDGDLWMYGINGINIFRPDQIKHNTYQPPVFLTKLTQGGKPLNMGTALERVQTIQLDWKNNFFEFELAALNYRYPEYNQYRYILEGVDQKWFDSNKINQGRYTGLNAGEYIFKIQGSNNDGLWSNKITEMRVIVTPAWWETIWFKASVILLLILAIFSFYQWRMRRMQYYQRQLEHQVQTRTQELQQAKETAETANQAKSTFLANMSHELRTPLNSILGFTEVMQRRSPSPQHREYLHLVHRSGRKLLNLINEILDLSKVEAGKLRLEYHPLNLYESLLETVQLMRERIEDKGLEFKIDLPEPDLIVSLDEQRLQQVVLNLLSNAVKFTEQGSIDLKVQYDWVDAENISLNISVQDTGGGIPEHAQQKIFKAFEQNQNINEAEGTGLGLTICQHLMELMGGDISLSSTVNQGSCFTVHFPQVIVLDGEDYDESMQVETTQINLQFSPACILIVDDSATNRALLRTWLDEYDFDCIEANNGKQAIIQATQSHPNLILMDIKMPVMDGRQATTELKANPDTRDIPVIAVTALVLKEELEQLKTLFDSALKKPLQYAQLMEILSTFLPCEKSTESEQGQTDTNPTTLYPPPLSALTELQQLAKLGKTKQIENWTKHWTQQDQCHSIFCQQVLKLAYTFDRIRLLEFIKLFIYKAE
ncbi:MAG: two-component regulator propeller domain-containing protein [Thiotrichaceae bacterium]|nr:two-component regulator propeller domain-containing protein [Thiotrichaceae bacterium]